MGVGFLCQKISEFFKKIKIMKKIKSLKFSVLLLCFIGVNAQNVDQKFKKVKAVGDIQEYLYAPNGMKILLLQDNATPVVTVQVVYSVGSKHEVLGNTGATHLLEHLNFKGTPTFNKKNGTAIFTVLQNIGAQMNATTWYDRTNYYETIPSDQIELALNIEADRMRNSLLLQEDKESEMTVVRNEFERGENNPSSVLNKDIWATAFMAHPYHHSTIGWLSDIENMPNAVLKNFYNTYYWPDNATLTIVGDFDKNNLFTLVDKYFGKVTKSVKEIPQPYTTEPVQLGPRYVTVKKPGQIGIVTMAYKIPNTLNKDIPALIILAEVLGSGQSSLLSTTFVDTGLALSGNAQVASFQDAGLFTVSLEITPDKNYRDINAKMLELIEKVKKDGISQETVDRIAAKLNAETILSRDGSGSISNHLTEAIANGDWTYYYKSIEGISAVTALDVKRVANTYLIEDQSTTGYFIPQIVGSNSGDSTQASNLQQEDSKFFFRNPEMEQTKNIDKIQETSILNSFLEIKSGYETIEEATKGEKFTRKKVAGIDVVTAKTGAKDFVSVAASFPISKYFTTGKNEKVPSLVTQMLSRGTTKNDKFVFSQKLEKLGVTFRIYATKNDVVISFKCLKKDIDAVVSLLSEELRYPLFDNKEFELLKEQNINSLKNQLNDPGTQAFIALSQAIYPKDNPNYQEDTNKGIEDLNAVTAEDLKAFHKNYFGPKAMHFVVVGDVDTKVLYNSLNKNFKTWTGGTESEVKVIEPSKVAGESKVIFIPQKPSAELIIGQYTGVKKADRDYIPFYIGTNILGGGFSARLMQTVRDNDGLTYNISAGLSGQEFVGGFWYTNASFNPSLFQKGEDATMLQIKKWATDGVTAQELADNKSNITGSFKVGLSTTSGLARILLSYLQRGLEPDYVTQFPKEIDAVTLEQVNNSIKKYIDLNKLIIIKAGSLEKDKVVK